MCPRFFLSHHFPPPSSSTVTSPLVHYFIVSRMFGTLTIISALTSVALAQSSSSSAAPGSSTQSPLVPSSASTTCAAFLNKLNADSNLKTCLDSLISATSAFSPGSGVSVTKATVTSALGNLCSDSVSAACPEQSIRTQITGFWTECNDELTKKNPDVIKLYDTIYAMSPLRTSVCSKDDSGTYCALASPSGGTKESSSNGNIAQLLATLYTTTGLSRRAPTVSPNMATFHDNNLVFLYYNPDLDAATLCTTCVRQILAAYVTFVSNVAYGPGLASSQLLDKQPALYEAVKNKCPAGFLSGPVQAAGGLSGGTLSGAALATAVPQHTTMIACLLGLFSVAISFVF